MSGLKIVSLGFLRFGGSKCGRLNRKALLDIASRTLSGTGMRVQFNGRTAASQAAYEYKACLPAGSQWCA